MEENLSPLDQAERLKVENDILKMKLMLERGAEFQAGDSRELTPQVENDFLKHVIAFEKQFEERKRIKIFDKIGRPGQFKPIIELPIEQQQAAWAELLDLLNTHNIHLDVCSPNISVAELYRFTVEELFDYEMDDIDMPGWVTHFIYDEFHPDPVYDNTQAATDECIAFILDNRPLEWMHYFRNEGLRLNQRHPLTRTQFRNIVNIFKRAYDNLSIRNITAIDCKIDNNTCRVEGSYSVNAAIGNESTLLEGNWCVSFDLDTEIGNWYISAVNIEGINF